MQLFLQGEQGLETIVLDGPLALTGEGSLVPADEAEEPLAVLVPHRGSPKPRRTLLLSRHPGVLLNGLPALPAALLRRGDELRCNGCTWYFTEENPLAIVPFDPTSSPVGPKAACSRCHRPLQAGEPVIYCPVCELPYMAQTDKDPNCWGYAKCVGCGRDPHDGFAWQPDI